MKAFRERRGSGHYVGGSPKPLTRCEVQFDGQWQPVDIVAVLQASHATPRCPSCHGALVVHRVYHGQGGTHFRHLRAHAGCPERGVRFSGVRSSHPQALT